MSPDETRSLVFLPKLNFIFVINCWTAHASLTLNLFYHIVILHIFPTILIYTTIFYFLFLVMWWLNGNFYFLFLKYDLYCNIIPCNHPNPSLNQTTNEMGGWLETTSVVKIRTPVLHILMQDETLILTNKLNWSGRSSTQHNTNSIYMSIKYLVIDDITVTILNRKTLSCMLSKYYIFF